MISNAKLLYFINIFFFTYRLDSCKRRKRNRDTPKKSNPNGVECKGLTNTRFHREFSFDTFPSLSTESVRVYYIGSRFRGRVYSSVYTSILGDVLTETGTVVWYAWRKKIFSDSTI